MADVNCSRYPVRKLILEGDKVVELFLWKSPTNGVPPPVNLEYVPPKSGCVVCDSNK